MIIRFPMNAVLVLFVAIPTSVLSQAQTPPEVPFVEEGVCPFEYGCNFSCITTKDPLTIYSNEGDTAHIAFVVAPGDTLYPTYIMNMYIERLGKAVVTKPIEGFNVQDTFYVLSYTGEGTWDIWYKGNILNVEGFWDVEDLPQFQARLLIEPLMSWWLFIRTNHGREGWLRLVNTTSYGIDFNEDIEFHYQDSGNGHGG